MNCPILSIYKIDGGTNIDFLLNDFNVGMTNWSVPKTAVPGDIAVFLCAKSARNNLGLATSHIPANYSQAFRAFVDKEKALYKKYSGYILGCGIVSAAPIYDKNDDRWYSDIHQLRSLGTLVHLDEFKSFITINPWSSITYLKTDQWERLKWVINQKNPGFFQNVIAPDVEILNQEFEKAVQKAGQKSLSQLKKVAEKKASQSVVSTVQTKVYHRDPAIAAYVKKRADGRCQLCGQKAPFEDPNSEPYLECHHIKWLSKGGQDSIDNCVALCPNCHRKMHIINDLNDINVLKTKLSK